MDNKKTEKTELSINWILSFAMADIDIFLLKEKNQISDKNKLYTKREIRKQLKLSLNKAINLAENMGYNVNKHLERDHFPSIFEK